MDSVHPPRNGEALHPLVDAAVHQFFQSREPTENFEHVQQEWVVFVEQHFMSNSTVLSLDAGEGVWESLDFVSRMIEYLQENHHEFCNIE